jgi:flagellar assembly protein FliH
MIYELIVPLRAPLTDVTLMNEAESPRASAAPAPPPGPDPQQLEKEAREALQRVMNRLVEVAEELQDQQRQRLEEMQRAAVELAVAVASRLVHERLDKGEFAVEALVRQAVDRLGVNQPVTVYLHPSDLALLEKRLATGSHPALNLTALRLTADASLGRGDCRAEAGDLSVLAKMQEGLADIRRHLLDTLPEATVDRRRPDHPLRRFPDRRQTA